jgi:hypothetical protein
MPAKNIATTVKTITPSFPEEDEVPALAYPKVPSRVVPFLDLLYRESTTWKHKKRPAFRFPPVHNVLRHLNEHPGNVILIKKHDKSDIVELDDGSLWRIWPGDIVLTLNWLPTNDLLVQILVTSFAPTRL